MRVAAAHEEPFRQRNEGRGPRGSLTGLKDFGAAEWVLHTHASRPGKHQLFGRSLLLAKRVIRRILYLHAAEVGLGAKIVRCNAGIKSGIASTPGFKQVIAMIVTKTESRLAHSHWL